MKYPLMFQMCDLVLINKMDTISYFDFDYGLVKSRILKLNSEAKILPISAKTGEGMEKVIDWIFQCKKELAK